MGAFQPNKRRTGPRTDNQSQPASRTTPVRDPSVRVSLFPNVAPQIATSTVINQVATPNSSSTATLSRPARPVRPIRSGVPVVVDQPSTHQPSKQNAPQPPIPTATPHLTPNAVRSPGRVPLVGNASSIALQNLVQWLSRHRPEVAANFSEECMLLYDNKYRRNPRHKSVDPSRATAPLQPLVTPTSLPVTRPTPPRSSLTAAPPSRPQPRTSNSGGPFQKSALRHQPEEHPFIDLSTLDHEPPEAANTRPSASSSESSVINLVDTPSWDEPLPVVDNPCFRHRATLQKKVESRSLRFSSGDGCPLERLSDDGLYYLIYQSPMPESQLVRLEVKHCSVALQDVNGYLSLIYRDVLRFLWLYLMEDPCTGAVFNHSIGLPRPHIIFTFAQIVFGTPSRERSTILVVCPASSLYEWRFAKSSFEPFFNLTFLDGDQISSGEADEILCEQIVDWKEKGGVLVCSEVVYWGVYKNSSDSGYNAFKALSSPGPDIIILDEASRISSIDDYDGILRRFLHRTRTSARLALTSVPMGGNIEKTWAVMNWACPDLFGTRLEFWRIYIRTIISGHKQGSSFLQGEKSFNRARVLYKKLCQVTFAVNPQKRQEELKVKGKFLDESIIFVNLGKVQMDVYQSLEAYLSRAVSHRDISPLVALHVLVTAASGINALLDFLNVGEKGNVRLCLEREDRQSFNDLRPVFNEMERIVGELRGETFCSKFEVILAISKSCLEVSERLVIFSGSQFMLEEIFEKLKWSLREADIFFYDLNAPPHQRKLPLDEFNKTQKGAVLVAPYGTNSDCLEGSGWGFVNATRILMADSSWNFVAAAQAVNRVHNFAQQNNVVPVHHLLASGTVEEGMSNVFDLRYSGMTTAIEKGDCFSNFDTNVDERGFLFAPEINDRMFREQPPNLDSCRAQPPEFKGMEGKNVEHESFPSFLRTLQLLRTEDSGYAVREVQLRNGMYEAMSKVLEMMMGGDTDRAVDHKEEVTIVMEQQALTLPAPKVNDVDSLRIHVERGNLDRMGDFLSQNSFYLEPSYRHYKFLMSWDSYFRIYECDHIPLYSDAMDTHRETRKRNDNHESTNELPERKRHRRVM